MENNNKACELTVGYYSQLDNMSLEDVGDFLEQEAEKHSITCRNWLAEYPYHPVTIFTIGRSNDALFIDFFVRGNYLRAVNYKTTLLYRKIVAWSFSCKFRAQKSIGILSSIASVLQMFPIVRNVKIPQDLPIKR